MKNKNYAFATYHNKVTRQGGRYNSQASFKAAITYLVGPHTVNEWQIYYIYILQKIQLLKNKKAYNNTKKLKL